MSTSDSYSRIATGADTYQCGCAWSKLDGWGDVLIECPIHRQATEARVLRFDAEIAQRKGRAATAEKSGDSVPTTLLPIVEDARVPSGEIHVVQGGVTICKIINIKD